MGTFIASAVLLVLVSSSTLAAEDNTKNHRLEKRQDAGYFFGGWRPVHPATSTSYFHTSSAGRYHDLISALPGSLDAASRYYTHALPSATNYKDIFSYYPRPAIRNRPRKNTPVYMERLKPTRQQPKQGSRGHRGGGGPQIIDIQNIDLKQIQGLQDLLLQAKDLPLTQLNLPKGGNPYDMLQLSLQALPQNGYNVGSSRSFSRYSRNKRPQASKGVYGSRMPQSYAPAQLPLQFQYIEMPKVKNLVPQMYSKDISIAPVQIPHQIRSLEDIMGLKNVQVIEVPVPVSSGKSGQGYGSRVNAYSQSQYQAPAPKTASKVSFPMNTYYTHQSQQPRQQYTSQATSGYSQQQQQQQLPQIEAELVKLSEEEIQGLLSKLQLVQKNSQEFLKVLPLAQASPHKSNNGQVQLIFSLPEDQSQGQQRGKSTGGYSAQIYETSQEDSYKGGEQYVAIPQDDQYSQTGNGGGYQAENQAVQHNAAGYQIEEQQQDGRSAYGQKYQTAQDMSGYGQPASYEQDSQNNGYAGDRQQDYKQSGYGSTARQPGQYLEIIAPPSENGYRREPVLAVEIQKGQTIADVIKAIDPKTLQQLGAHGKEGLEIEVVEVPVEEYSAESKKKETYVASTNATTEPPTRKSSAATATTVSQDKSTTTAAKKSKS